MYVPQGFIGPLIVIANVIMQKLWMEKVDLDTELNVLILNEWLPYYY